jgi:hypothetical protein
MTIRKFSAVLVIFCAALWGTSPASAHHSLAAEFDPDKQITVTGTITRVEWTNPHIYWYVEAKNDASSAVDLWTFEGPPPGMLHRTGVTKDVFKIGEIVTVTAYPAKDGTQHFGFGQKARYADGHEIYFNRL